MAGDEISAKTDYFYLANPNSPGGESNLSPLLTSLGVSITGSGLSDKIKNATTAITNQFTPGSALVHIPAILTPIPVILTPYDFPCF